MTSSSPSSPKWNYDVVLSFRGEDTGKNFVDHLYEALNQKGIYTFKDDEVLERGKSISPELLKAIQESRFAIVVFSKNYSSSSWCLDELLQIVDCRAEKGQIVIPVFYDVDPSQVRKQSGLFGDAFARHDDCDRVGKWREALVQVANISGWDIANVENGHESKCIQKLVNKIGMALDRTVSNYGQNLVGIDSRTEDLKRLLSEGSIDVRMVGVWGMGGIGKTTITTALYEKMRDQFEGACFLSEVRANSKKQGISSIENLQKTLLSEILNIKNLKVNNVYEGSEMIKNRLRYKKVLIVLDDVDHLDQLEALAKDHKWFGMGSIIIVTTRNKHLLLCHGVDAIYKVDVLNDKEALQLFSWKAFKKSRPEIEYNELSLRVVRYAGGLPLALKVLGSLLCCRGMADWKSAVDRLKKVPENEIIEKLRISYDELDDEQKEVFLDIACFFNGAEEDYVKRRLNSFDFYPDIGISVLIERSLLVFSNGHLLMHDLIQELGWLIVRQRPPIPPGKRSRLWLAEDVYSVLTENMGTDAIEGIVLDFPERGDKNFSNDAFVQMKRLRLLKVHNDSFSSGIEYLPNELKWIDWFGYPSKTLPVNFEASKLVGLTMRRSRIVQLWKGAKHLNKLKFIDLSHSQKLIRTPDFTEVRNLKSLNLEDCSSLVEIHPSIGLHKNITFLSFKYCKNLKSLPKNILSDSLEVFILSGCVKLDKFPEISGNMERLLELYLNRTAIKGLPSSIEHLKSLVRLDLSSCKNLTSLPNTICSLSCLKFLTLSGCSKLDKLPDKLGSMECLEELQGDNTAIRQLPSSIVLLKNLKVLSFSGNKGSAIQSWSSPFLPKLFRGKYQNSFSMVLPSLKGLSSLIKLDLRDCSLLDGGIPDDIGCLSFLKVLNLSGNNFVNVPATISQLSKLEILELKGCKSLATLPQLPLSIAELYADECPSLKGIGDLLPKYEKMFVVSLSNCFNLVDQMADMLWKLMFQLISTQVLQDKYYIFRQFSVFIPGTEIPESFKMQGVGPLFSVDLPPQWHSNKFLGFAICTVIAPISTFNGFGLRNVPIISVKITLKTADGTRHTHVTLMGCSERIVNLSHVFLGYLDFDSLRLSSFRYLRFDPDSICKFEASLYRHDKEYLKKWGLRLLYAEEDIKQEFRM